MSSSPTVTALAKIIRYQTFNMPDSDALALAIASAIERGEVEGLALKTYDGTTCWHCDKCGRTRDGKGCRTCDANDLATSPQPGVMVDDAMVERARVAAADAMGHPHLDHIHSDVVRAMLRAALSAAIGGEDGWVKCSDRLPMSKPYSARVLIYARYGKEPDATGKICVGWLFGTDEWRTDSQTTMDTMAAQGWNVTHWRPLPPPPSANEGH